jgi:hypothetical protein
MRWDVNTVMGRVAHVSGCVQRGRIKAWRPLALADVADDGCRPSSMLLFVHQGVHTYTSYSHHKQHSQQHHLEGVAIAPLPRLSHHLLEQRRRQVLTLVSRLVHPTFKVESRRDVQEERRSRLCIIPVALSFRLGFRV